MMADEAQFQVGQPVDKASGYQFPGIVRAVFQNGAGQWRFVVEMNHYGLLHIFNAGQLKPAASIARANHP